MEWYWVLAIIFGSLLVLMGTAMPVAFAFLLVDLVGVYILWGGGIGVSQFILSLGESVTSFTLLPVPLFMLMGEVLAQSGLAPQMLDAIDRWIGRVPGRLALLAVGGGTVFATLTGTTMASAAMLGETLVPEMTKKGYSKGMTLGPILGSAGLAVLIPPSGIAVIFGALAEVSIGSLLLSIITPGILLAIVYAAYIIVRCRLQPSIAPNYAAPATPLKEKMALAARYLLPVGAIIFAVIGFILLGVATPTEAAATGALGCVILVWAQGRMNMKVWKKTLAGTIRITGMIMLIIMGAETFSRILGFSGGAAGATRAVMALNLSPILIFIAMQVAGFIMGMFMSSLSIMMITVPLFIPIVKALGIDPIWFGTCFILNMELAAISPPFGLTLFVLGGIAQKHNMDLEDVYRAAYPFVALEVLVMVIMIAAPILSTWLPHLMRTGGG